MLESGKVQFELLPNNVVLSHNVGQAEHYNNLIGAVATVGQKLADNDQAIFMADELDHKEFGQLLKIGETLVRVASPLASNDNNGQHRSIAFIDVSKGKITFVDNDSYEIGDLKRVPNPLKFRFLNIDKDKFSLFGIE